MRYPKTLTDLIECYKKLPGIGEKTAERMALATLEIDNDIIELFSESLLNAKNKIVRCKKCNNLAEGDLCEICKTKDRDIETICVVEDPRNVVLFEKIGSYRGLYYVLDGLISPLDGIEPNDININSLIERVNKEKIKEVIIAVKPSIEGETTALYISKVLESLPVRVSRIARGVPIGVDMEYIDALTLELALEDREKLS